MAKIKHYLALFFTLFALIASQPMAQARNTFSEAHRFIFYAVMEGCYEDGLSTKDVTQILLQSKGGSYVHFIYACPICAPTIQALEAYQARPKFFYGLKVMYGQEDKADSTFGPGLSPELKAKLYSEKPEERLTALNSLMQGWIAKRMKQLRLSDTEQAQLNKDLSAMRDKGTNLLKENLKQANGQDTSRFMASAFTNFQQCAACNAACGLNLKLNEKK